MLGVQDDITRKGVVFNEMKGVYSSPDSVNQRTVQHSLFPDNTYGEDSGGDPKVIPELTFEEFKVCSLLQKPLLPSDVAAALFQRVRMHTDLQLLMRELHFTQLAGKT